MATYDIAAQVKYGKETLDEAGYNTLMKKLKSQGGDGGVIGLDSQGGVVIHFNTVAMPRGYINSNCLLYTSPSPRDVEESRMPSSA